MAEWSWESPGASSSQQASPMQSSPLQSSSSQSSHEASNLTSHEMQQHLDTGRGTPGRAAGVNSSKSLVETLQTCLTSLPHSTNAPPISSPTGRSLGDPSGASPPATLRQSRSGGTLSGSTSRPLGPTKPAKRRSRASRRVPTTVLEATLNEFRDTVQRLTGTPAANPAPVRPQPQRLAGPASTYIRPDPLVRPVRPPAAELLNFSTPSTRPASSVAFDLQPLQRSASEQFNPFLNSIKREIDGMSLPTMPLGVSGRAPTSGTLSASLPGMKSWWDGMQEQSVINEIGASGPSIVASSAAQIVSQDDQELSLSQIDAWLLSQDRL